MLGMTTEIAPSGVEELISALDPDRDYGERAFDEVVAQVRAGTLALSPGRFGLPRITDVGTGQVVPGTAMPPLSGSESPRDWGLRRFRELAAEQFDVAWAQLLQGMDPAHKSSDKFHKLFWETFIGKPGEARSQLMDAVAETLLRAAASNSTSSLVAEDVTDGEFEDKG